MPPPSAPPVQAAPAPSLPEPPPLPEPTPVPAPAASAPLALTAPKAAKTESRAALLLPLSGPQAATGLALSNAAQLALFEIADSHFSLIPLDTKGTADGAAAAMAQAVAQGADIILGPVFSFEVKAAAPLALENALPMLAFTTDATVAGNGIYALGYLPGPQVARVIAHARDQGRRRIAVLARSDEYGRAVADAAQQAASNLGVDLIAVEYYDPAQTDFTALVKRLAARRPAPGEKAAYDAILIGDDGVRLRNLTSLLSYYLTAGEPPRLLGTLLWDDPRLASEPSLIGGWYPAPPSSSYEAFEQRYTKAFGPIPARVPGLLAGIAYDATALAALMARQGHGDYSADSLQSPLGFLGAGGLFRLTPAGLAERGLAIREITPQGAREIAPAPATF